MSDTNGNNGLWRILSDGSDPTQIFSGLAEHPKWSPDGQFIVFDSDTGNSTKLIPVAGGKPIVFLPDSIQINKGGLPIWSPDGSKIAFKDSEYYLCIYDVKTKQVKRAYKSEDKLLLPGCWGNDNKSVFVALMDKETRRCSLWKISVDGQEIVQIKGHHNNFYRYLALSPDGRMLVYAAKVGRFLEFHIMPAGGGESIPLVLAPEGHNEAPVWSPDGTKIAYSRSQGWNVDIWVMEVNFEYIISKLE
jgi:Tol biopolymer transport system component